LTRTFGGHEPLSAILEAVQPLGQGEQFQLTLNVAPATPQQLEAIRKQLTRQLPPNNLASLVVYAFGKAARIPKYQPKDQRELEQRLINPCLIFSGTVSLAGPRHQDLADRRQALEAAFSSRFNAGFGGISLSAWQLRSPLHQHHVHQPGVHVHHGLQQLAGDQLRQLVSIAELAAVWHPPSPNLPIPNIAKLKRTRVVVPMDTASADGLLLGTRYQRGHQINIYLPRQDLHAGSLSIIGMRGSGKSTLAINLVGQLAASPDQPAIVAIDPHGEMVTDVCRQAISLERATNTILLELGEADRPVSLPFFDRTPGLPIELVAQETFKLTRTLFAAQWSPSRMADGIWAMTATLCQLPEATLLDVGPLFTDPFFPPPGASKKRYPGPSAEAVLG
jgi:hypothetical protein